MGNRPQFIDDLARGAQDAAVSPPLDDTAKWVIMQIFAHGRVRRAYIGVDGTPIS